MPPVTQKLIAGIALFVVILGACGAGIYAKADENAKVEAEVNKLNDEIKGFDEIIATKEQQLKLRAAQEDIFKELVAILPQYTEKQDEHVLDLLTSYASVAKLETGGVVIDDSKSKPGTQPQGGPPPGPGAPAAKDFAQTTLKVQYQGTFFNFLKFVNMIENCENFLRVDQFSLSPLPYNEKEPQPEHRKLTIGLTISTFHYAAK